MCFIFSVNNVHADLSTDSKKSADLALEINNIVQRSESENWHQDIQWLRLVQYQKTLLSGFESPAKSSKFFLSTKGSTDPKAELQATIKELLINTKKIKSQDGQFEDLVGCVFPARRLWLEKKIGKKLPQISCERFERFIEILQPQSLTYVFSSYYLNNPASAFGHTFLRINKSASSKDGDRYVLSDYGVGYAALKVSENPFVYSFLGVSGLMPGSFDINPYYYKVREYNDFESRDLWEYDLNFNQDEVKMVMAYIWELLDVNFNYHYFSQNCSYRILSILEMARPSLNLTEVLKQQVMPADTVQTLYEQNQLVQQIHFRPSVRTVFEHRYKFLNEKQKNKIINFAKNESIDQLLQSDSTDLQRQNLDAAIDYLDYRYPKEMMLKQGKYFFKKDILLKRAELGGATPILNLAPPERMGPHEAHGSRRLGLGLIQSESDIKFYLFDFKLSLHDLLDPKWGYPPSAEITMGHLGLQWDVDQKKLDLDYFKFYEVISLAPISHFSDGASWRLKFSNESGLENNCLNKTCRWTELSGGTGASVELLKNFEASLWLRVSGLASADFYQDHWVIGAGPGLLLRWVHKDFSFLGESYYRYDYKGQQAEYRQNSIGLNYSVNRSLGIRAYFDQKNNENSSKIKIHYYY